jgi:TldD protein
LGFAASNDLSKLEETAKKAFEIAKASQILQAGKAALSPKPVNVGTYSTPVKTDPFTVPLNDKLGLLMSCEKAMMAVDGVSKTSSNMSFRKDEVTYCDTDGSYITQNFCQSGGGVSAIAQTGTDTQTRSYPDSFRGNYHRAGYEFILEMDMPARAEEIAKEAVALVNAPECPSGIFDLVIDTTQMTLQIHESVGHPTELDRVLGYEAAYAGASFVRPEDLSEELIYGSPHVTIVADATYPGGLGTFGYDDEGVAAERTVIIDKGVFKGFTSSRDTAAKVGIVSSGAAIADGWHNLPIVRMTNINIMPGSFTTDELIAGVDDGFMLSVNKSWSIDDKRINFQFACEAAYEIKNGKKTGRIFKNPIYSGITTQFWGSCDGVASEEYWHLRGTPNCGKGQPMQVARVGHGSAPARFRNVKVGVADVK